MGFSEELFICGAIVTAMVAGVLIFHGLGLMVVKIWDRAKQRKRWAVVKRCL